MIYYITLYNSKFGLEIGVPSLCKKDAVGKLSRLRTQFITDVSLYNADALIFESQGSINIMLSLSYVVRSLILGIHLLLLVNGKPVLPALLDTLGT